MLPRLPAAACMLLPPLSATGGGGGCPCRSGLHADCCCHPVQVSQSLPYSLAGGLVPEPVPRISSSPNLLLSEEPQQQGGGPAAPLWDKQIAQEGAAAAADLRRHSHSGAGDLPPPAWGATGRRQIRQRAQGNWPGAVGVAGEAPT